MEQNLVFRNDELIKETTESFARLIPQFQAVIDQFSDLQIGKIETRDELINAVRQPEQFLLSKMTLHLKNSDQPTFGGFKLQPEKLIEMLDLKEKSEFLQACDHVRSALGFFSEIGTVKKGKVESDPKLVEQFIQKNEIYAITDREKIVFQSMKMIRDGMQLLWNADALPYKNWQMNMNALLEKSENTNFRLSISGYNYFSK